MGEPSGFYDRKTEQTFIKFSGERMDRQLWRVFEDADAKLCTDWVQGYLQRATQIALRAEMQRACALSDVEGYIYAFEILGLFTSHFPYSIAPC